MFYNDIYLFSIKFHKPCKYDNNYSLGYFYGSVSIYTYLN